MLLKTCKSKINLNIKIFTSSMFASSIEIHLLIIRRITCSSVIQNQEDIKTVYKTYTSKVYVWDLMALSLRQWDAAIGRL